MLEQQQSVGLLTGLDGALCFFLQRESGLVVNPSQSAHDEIFSSLPS